MKKSSVVSKSKRQYRGITILLPCFGFFFLISILPKNVQSQSATQQSLTPNMPQDHFFDPTDSSFKTFLDKFSLIHIFLKGGLIMWPLLLASILAQGTIIERIIFLINERRHRQPKALESFLSAVGNNDIHRAIEISAQSKFYVLRVLGYALIHQERSTPSALIFAQEQELKRFRRGMALLDTVITLAPLLGLLGTVTGMMGSFSLIGGDLGAPGAITGGIAEALIATAFGLGIAITSLIPFNLVNNKIEEVKLEIEAAATQLELLVIHASQTQSSPPSRMVTSIDPFNYLLSQN